jgi:hypothetical protein
VVRVRQSGCIHEVAVVETDLLGLLVHQVGEGGLAAGNPFRHDLAGVVARLDDDAFQQVVETDHRVDLEEHGRAAARGSAPLPRRHADGKLVGELELAGLQALEDDVDRHQFGERCRRHRLLGVLVVEDRAGLVVDDDGFLGRRFQGRRRGVGCRSAEADEHGGDKAAQQPGFRLKTTERRHRCFSIVRPAPDVNRQ